QENDFPILSIPERDLDLHCSTGIETRANTAGKPNAAQGSGICRRAVAPEELRPIPGYRPDRVAAVHENDAAGELGAVRIAREGGAAERVRLRDDVHERLVAQFAQHQRPVAGHGKLASLAGAVGDFEANKLDRRIGRDIVTQLGDDTILIVLEKGVTEAVAG